jgi:hypothetical protein
VTPHRLSIKLYFADGVAVDPPRFVPLFHEWIRTGAVEGLLIDVADYKHVHHGPATVLVGHEVDYAIDLSEGRPGLTITRKRKVPGNLRDDLRTCLRRLLLAAAALSRKSDPHPPVRFRTNELRVQAIDRLNFDGGAESVAALGSAAHSALKSVYQDAELKIDAGNPDPRAPLTLWVTAAGEPELDALLARLDASK